MSEYCSAECHLWRARAQGRAEREPEREHVLLHRTKEHDKQPDWLGSEESGIIVTRDRAVVSARRHNGVDFVHGCEGI